MASRSGAVAAVAEAAVAVVVVVGAAIGAGAVVAGMIRGYDLASCKTELVTN